MVASILLNRALTGALVDPARHVGGRLGDHSPAPAVMPGDPNSEERCRNSLCGSTRVRP